MSTIIRVHLITGDHVDSADASLLTDEEVTKVRTVIEDMAQKPPEDGWHVSFDTPGGGRAMFPRSSVLYVELVGFGAVNA